MYSKVHNSYSTIDHFAISNHLFENVINCQIQNIIISDHAPLVLSIIPKLKTTPKPTWKFNNSLLGDKEFVSLTKISEFITLNIDSVSSIQIVWAALKVTSRGWIISYSTAKKKQSMDERHKLQLLLKDLERKHMQNPNNLGIKKELFLVKSKLQTFIHKETAYALYRLCQKTLESGDKAGKILALR